uniref:Uncharacterized protein n=1 Tax=Homalodisca liturata TaxID=320908 RepID=A0A1B6J2Z8_9HEMI
MPCLTLKIPVDQNIFVDYNKAKVGTDLSDQMSFYSTTVQKTMLWLHKVGEELPLGTSVFNSWLAYNSFLNSKTNPNAQEKKHVVSITQFKEKLACSLKGVHQEPHTLRITATDPH